MQALLIGNITTGKLSEGLDGNDFTWPVQTQGDDLKIQLRLAQNVSGSPVLVSRVVHGMKATLGRVDARPLFGEFKIKVGTDAASAGVNLTTALQFDAPADTVEQALGALSGGFAGGQTPVSVFRENGSWLVKSADGTQLNLSRGDNTLQPLSFVRVREFQFDGKWISEIRLIQAPVAFASTFARVVPPPPSIREIRSGGSNEVAQWDEVQALTVPPTFLGTFDVTRPGLTTKSGVMDRLDGIKDIQKKIGPLADKGGSLTVSLAQDNIAYIDFGGTMAGRAQDELVVEVVDAPEGDLTVVLSLNTAALDALLRAAPIPSGADAPQITLPFELEINIEDENDSATRYTLTWTSSLTVRAELAYSELTVGIDIPWDQPPQPKSYVPTTVDQITVGSQNVWDSLGDGILRSFPINHNLDADTLAVVLRENKDNGKLLVQGADEDYNVVFNTRNQLTISMVSMTPPAVGALMFSISLVGTRSVFQSHTHTIAEIVGLQDELTALLNSVAVLNTRLGIDPAPAPPVALDVAGASWTLEKTSEVFGAASDAIPPDGGLVGIDLSKLTGRGAGLLPAVHAISFTAFPGGNPSVANVGILYKNTGSAVLVNGGQKHKSFTLAANAFCASNGTIWYPVERYDFDALFVGFGFTAVAATDIGTIATGLVPVDGTRVRFTTTGTLPAPLVVGTDYFIRDSSAQTCKLAATSGGSAINITDTGSGTHSIGQAPRSSWYPLDMDRTLFEFAVTGAELRLNLMLDLQFGIEYAIFKSSTIAQWVLVVEWAPFVEDTTPARTGPNVGDDPYNAVPILTQRLWLTSTPAARTFGVQIRRSLQADVDTITGSKIIMGSASGADSLPPSADFMIRARLTRWDTKDSQFAARGFPAFRAANVGTDGGTSSQVGTAQIKAITAASS